MAARPMGVGLVSMASSCFGYFMAVTQRQSSAERASKSTAVKSVLASRPGFRQKYQESVLTSFPRRECVRTVATDRPFCPPPAAAALLIAMRMMRSQQAPSNENDVPHMCKCRHASAETDRGIDHRYKLTVRQVMHLDLLGKESIHPLKSG